MNGHVDLNAMKMFFLIAPFLYVVNIIVAFFFVKKYSDRIYKTNLFFWVSYLFFGISQAVISELSLNVRWSALLWTLCAFPLSLCLALSIENLYKVASNPKKDVSLFFGGFLTSAVLFRLGVEINYAILPAVFFTSWPNFKLVGLLKTFNKNVFTKNGYLICAVLTSFHILDYAYAVNKPELIFPGYLAALILATGISCFSFASLVERALLEVEIRSLLNNTSRLTSIGAVAGEVVHEINNPLTIISATNNLLKGHLDRESIDRDYIKSKSETIEKMLMRLNKIIENLKDSCRGAESDSVAFWSLDRLIDDATFLCELKAHKFGVKLKIKVELDPIEIECRAVQVTQIIQNLIGNSIDAIEKLDDRWVEVSYLKISNELVEIRVVDSGVGVPVEIRDRIFENLFTTKKDGRGTGMGLNISKRMAEDHGGSLKIDIQARNTTFVLTLPLDQSSRSQSKLKVAG